MIRQLYKIRKHGRKDFLKIINFMTMMIKIYRYKILRKYWEIKKIKIVKQKQ